MHKFFKRKKGDFYCTIFLQIKKLKEKLLYETKLFIIHGNKHCIFFYIAVNPLDNVKWTPKCRKKRVQGTGDFLWEGRTLKIAGLNFFITKTLGFKLCIYVCFTCSWPQQLERAAVIFCLKLRTWHVNVRIFI